MASYTETLLAEHARQHEIWRRNMLKSISRETKPTARFANAAHATKALARLARIEDNLRRAGVPIPSYEEES